MSCVQWWVENEIQKVRIFITFCIVCVLNKAGRILVIHTCVVRTAINLNVRSQLMLCRKINSPHFDETSWLQSEPRYWLQDYIFLPMIIPCNRLGLQLHKSCYCKLVNPSVFFLSTLEPLRSTYSFEDHIALLSWEDIAHQNLQWHTS